MYLTAAIGWIMLTILFYKYWRNFIIAKNWVSLVHALIVVIFYLTNINETILFYISCTYYLLDTIYTVYYYVGIFDFGLILHHIFTIGAIIYLTDEEASVYIRFIFFVAELSNLPMYFAEYFEMIGDKRWTYNFILLEVLSYIILRLIFGLYVMYDVIKLEFPFIIIAAGTIIYIATFVLVVSQIKKLFSSNNIPHH